MLKGNKIWNYLGIIKLVTAPFDGGKIRHNGVNGGWGVDAICLVVHIEGEGCVPFIFTLRIHSIQGPSSSSIGSSIIIV